MLYEQVRDSPRLAPNDWKTRFTEGLVPDERNDWDGKIFRGTGVTIEDHPLKRNCNMRGCGNCESGRGCPRGMATTDPELSSMMGVEWIAQRLINLYASWRHQIVEVLGRLGMRGIQELRGRTDCLIHLSRQGGREKQ